MVSGGTFGRGREGGWVGRRCIGGWGGNAAGILDRGRLASHAHLCHPQLHEALTLNLLLVSLITEVLLDPSTHRNGALVLIAVLSMRYAEQDKLLTDFAHVPLVGEHQLALSGVGQDTLHLDTARLFAVSVVALCCMYEVAYALLNGGLSLLLGILRSFLK